MGAPRLSLSIRSHLNRQTIKIVLIAYAVSLAILLIGLFMQSRRNQDGAAASLVRTMPAEVNLLLPTLLLTEEQAGQELLLNRFRAEEGLSAVAILPVEAGTPKAWRGLCVQEGGYQTCRRVWPSQVAIFAPIIEGTREFGVLMKIKDLDTDLLTKAFLPSAAVLAIALLLSLGGLVWLVTRLTNQEIPAAADMLLEEVRRALQGEPKSQEGTFKFEEFRGLSEALDSLVRSAQNARRDAAIAQTTQMLAHDVRKPFTILRLGLNMLSNARDKDHLRQLLGRIVPEVDRAVRDVDGMISDVMEIGSASTELVQEPIFPEDLIRGTQEEIFRIYPKANISISYNLSHTTRVSVQIAKVRRVFSNIFGNAVQAMNSNGHVWFKTRDVQANGKGFVEFCLGNADSLIPPDNLVKLFDAFFTSGKRGGTGLGLAIAQKVVVAHGGRIWCESSKTEQHPGGKVEFFFTLPAIDESAVNTLVKLPTHSNQITSKIGLLQEAEAMPSVSLSKAEADLEQRITAAVAKMKRPIQILVVDDEDIYRAGLQALLSGTPGLADSIQIAYAADSSTAIEYLARDAFDLVVTDIDLGHNSLDGFELVHEIRRVAFNAKCLICVHSNRVVAADHKTAIEHGADAFLPKPLAREHLLKLVLQAAQAAPTAKPGGAPEAFLPEIAVVEDNPFILDAWVDALQNEAIVHAADSPEALADKIALDPQLLERLICVVTDYHFDNSLKNGMDVGAMLKQVRPDLQVLLSSDGTFNANDMIGRIDRVIRKEPLNLVGLTT